MKLQQTIQNLSNKFPRSIDLSLERVFHLLDKMGNPQNKIDKVVSVVGTNGKYSIAQSLRSILNQANYKINCFYSPHIAKWQERFVYEDKEIDEEELIELLQDVEKILGNDQATLFEILFCAYLKKCEKYKDSLFICETGLFHRLDATNVFKSNKCTILSTCAEDHYSWLKNKTINSIIFEKTVALVKDSNIFVNKQENKQIVLKIKKALENNKSNKYFFGEDFHYLKAENNFIQYEDHKGAMLLPPPNILGNHQLCNVSTAIAVARTIFNVQDQHIKKGIISIKLKGRLEKIKFKNLSIKNEIYVDIAHNGNAARAIRNWIESSNFDFHLVISMMKDKDHSDFGESLFKNNNKIKSITLIDIPDTPGAISKEELKKKFNKFYNNIVTKDNIFDAINSLRTKPDDKILITGSAYLVGKVLNLN